MARFEKSGTAEMSLVLVLHLGANDPAISKQNLLPYAWRLGHEYQTQRSLFMRSQSRNGPPLEVAGCVEYDGDVLRAGFRWQSKGSPPTQNNVASETWPQKRGLFNRTGFRIAEPLRCCNENHARIVGASLASGLGQLTC